MDVVHGRIYSGRVLPVIHWRSVMLILAAYFAIMGTIEVARADTGKAHKVDYAFAHKLQTEYNAAYPKFAITTLACVYVPAGVVLRDYEDCFMKEKSGSGTIDCGEVFADPRYSDVNKAVLGGQARTCSYVNTFLKKVKQMGGGLSA